MRTTGAVDPTSNPMFGPAAGSTLVLSGNRLYADGSFTSVTTPGESITRNRLALVDATTGVLDLTFNSNIVGKRLLRGAVW
jgi:hypothetical protein